MLLGRNSVSGPKSCNLDKEGQTGNYVITVRRCRFVFRVFHNKQLSERDKTLKGMMQLKKG